MALERELLGRGHRVAREVSVHVGYKSHVLGVQRIDMIVDERVVVETKSTPSYTPVRGDKSSTTCVQQPWKSGFSSTSDWSPASIGSSPPISMMYPPDSLHSRNPFTL